MNPIQVDGEALDAHAGAVITGADFLYYIDGLDAWPDDILGKRIRVTGVLRTEKRIPDGVGPHPAAGAGGTQSILYEAKWELLPVIPE